MLTQNRPEEWEARLPFLDWNTTQHNVMRGQIELPVSFPPLVQQMTPMNQHQGDHFPHRK